MANTRAKKRVSPLKDLPVIFRSVDLENRGISREYIQTMLRRGTAERIGRGLYRLKTARTSELYTVALVAAAVPAAIVCLLTALQIHEIGTQSPHHVWIAIDRKARKPANLPAGVRIVRFSGALLTFGVQRHTILGVSVRITSPARTIVDCFRYRNKIGLDVAIEALRDGVRARKVKVNEIVRAAEVCRARTIIQPYLEVLVS